MNLVKILKDCPKGTKLYSPIFGEVELEDVIIDTTIEHEYPIEVISGNGDTENFARDGRFILNYCGECMLFPSKENRDWDDYAKQLKAKPKPTNDKYQFKPYEKVLVRDTDDQSWKIDFFGYIKEDKDADFPYVCLSEWAYCIPYKGNEHLLGTKDNPTNN